MRVHERPEQEAVLPTLLLDAGGEDGAAELADCGDEDEPEAPKEIKFKKPVGRPPKNSK